MGMRIPLHVTGLDREKRFVDFSVAGPPTSGGIMPISTRPVPTAKHHGKPKPKPAPRPDHRQLPKNIAS